MPITQITSRQNPLIVATSALREKKYRDKARNFLLEGKKLFIEALQSNVDLLHIFTTEESLPFCLEQLKKFEKTHLEERIVFVSESVFEKISTEKSPQGVLCVAEYLDKSHFFSTIYNEEILDMQGKRVFILSSLRDPGNLGTVIRTARAFGVDTLILSADCADLYSPKTVRAAMGTLFRQKIHVVPDLPSTVTDLKNGGKKVFAAMLDENAKRLDQLALDVDTVFVVGNEGHGIDPSVASSCTGSVMIPMAQDSAESLNAAIASAILLWQSFSSR